MIQFIGIFLTVFALDLIWARYTKSIQDNEHLGASLYAALIYILAGVSTIAFVNNHFMIFAGAAGAIAGTYSALALWHWFTLDWWRYLFQKRVWDDVSWFRVILCRAKGHPDGVIWYSSGMEPDMTCKCCGDDLG